MEGSLEELIRYRPERAKEMIDASEENLEAGQFRTSLNRSYYAVFHAMRAVNATDHFDSSKHSGVIAHFNKEYLKEGKLDKDLSKIVKDSSYLREKSDYDDFYMASRADAEKQLENAKIFVSAIGEYLKNNTNSSGGSSVCCSRQSPQDLGGTESGEQPGDRTGKD